ncbi:methyl-accepting chemotaxis protein [Maridesulfovibrio zosterae]|uniref:methyl-accepting chemotaxis protein n=1 Tax=Maridesulfovibrio zosterae TaxID=82171 RepID=UPI0004066867|nr:methyl-accepting chemotaxis protein [Maridesulfovibrio zosterae]
MLKKFSVTTKIAGAFAIILIFLALTASQGVFKLGESKDDFINYRELAIETNLAAEIQEHLLLTRISAINYMNAATQKSQDEYTQNFKKLLNFVEQAHEKITNTVRASFIIEIKKNLSVYNNNFNNYIKHKNIEDDSLALAQKNGELIVQGLKTLLESANQREDSFMTAMVEKSLATLYKARLHNAYFIYNTKDEKDANNSLKEFSSFKKDLRDIQNILYAPSDLGLINEMGENIEKYISSTRMFVKQTVAMAKIQQEMAASGPIIAKLIDKFKTSVVNEQEGLGKHMHTSISSAITTMTTSSIIIFIVGMLLSFFISRSITVPLKKASIFVKDLANGNLDSKIDVDQRDEVGRICDDVALVGNTLREVISEIETAIDDIEIGKIDSKADRKDFKGSFAELIDRTNLATGVLKSFINEVPMPIITIDTNMAILFINKAGTKLLGKSFKDVQGNKCSKMINTPDCETPNCACYKSMKSSQIENGTTSVRLPDSELNIDYIGIPISKDGKVVGAMEVIIDQTGVRSAQKRMQDVAQRTQLISEQLSSASEEMAAQIEQISKGSEIQRERIVETATAMDQMNSTIMEVAQNASSASSNSLEAKSQAEEGAARVTKSVKSITEIHSIAEDLRENMQSLGQKTESISTVMDVISDIADQTNLLALNAAIEAARAGEAGRGFAVVADEVRKLAEKTMTATQEVGESIKNIQTSVRMNMQEVENAVGAVQDTTDLARQSGESLESIVKMVETSANQVESIATASEEQSSASEEINGAISEINLVARETTEGIQQSAKAIQELSVMSNDLSKLIRELRNN